MVVSVIHSLQTLLTEFCICIPQHVKYLSKLLMLLQSDLFSKDRQTGGIAVCIISQVI